MVDPLGPSPLALLGDPDPAKSRRVIAAMIQMTKLEADALQRAYEQA
jgi:hypothetical protein